MEMPSTVRKAVLIIWATFFLYALVGLYDKILGNIDSAHFSANLVVYAILCIIPYKIGTGSNAAKYAYAILMVLSTISMFAMMEIYTKADLISSVIATPFEFFAIFLLFKQESKPWFTKKISARI